MSRLSPPQNMEVESVQPLETAVCLVINLQVRDEWDSFYLPDAMWPLSPVNKALWQHLTAIFHLNFRFQNKRPIPERLVNARTGDPAHSCRQAEEEWSCLYPHSFPSGSGAVDHPRKAPRFPQLSKLLGQATQQDSMIPWIHFVCNYF